MTCSRRQVILGSGVAIFAAAKQTFAQTSCLEFSKNKLPASCAWYGANTSDFQIFSTSGRNQIDRALIAELRRIVTVIPVNPGFKYINDQNPNAFADPNSIVPNTNGTVYIGLNLINSEFEQTDGGVAVAGICAHECGHIYQFTNGWADKLAGQTARSIELHADFLAGFYMGRSGNHSAQRVQVFGRSLFSKGDYHFNDEDHHGTPEERVASMRQGYQLGAQSNSIESAADMGADFVSNL